MAKKRSQHSEAERQEARWFEENQDELMRLFREAQESGALRIGASSVYDTLIAAIEGKTGAAVTGTY